ncbi:hypothetical protein B0H14DRAFT_2555126 [Mycena olivaceomarginata]|nr:hypothetical protein B0H14DRAFT_2555126 [Mycena olivaceomarginata]
MPTGFTESEDKRKILCMICERNGCGEWIVRNGDKKHLGSKNHGRNVEASNIRVTSQVAIQNQNTLINATLQRLDIPLAGKKPHYAEHVPSTEEQEMWDQYQTDGATFTAGHDPAVEDETQEANLVRQAEQFGRWNATSITRNLGFMDPESEILILEEDDEEDALLCEMLDNARKLHSNHNCVIPQPLKVDIEMEGQSRVKSMAEWYPYPTKMLNLHNQGGVPTVSWTSTQGNVFHLNDIRKIVAKDYANPLTCSLLHFYPEIPDGPLARLRNGSFVIPLCWVIFKGEMHADAVRVIVDGNRTARVEDTTEIMVRARYLLDNYLDLKFKKSLPTVWDAVYDQSTEQEAAVRVFVNTGPSDNPMGSEMTAHIGAKGNYFCRKCKVGGCGEHKRTDAGFHSMFEEGAPPSAAETLEELHKQVEFVCLGVKATVEACQTDTGVKDTYTNHWINNLLWRSRELKKSDPTLDTAVIVQQLMDWVTANESTIYNPFLSLKGFDVSKDTPIEILHTILLGIVKYAWHSTHTSWNAAKKTSYTLRLQAANTVGLLIPLIRANYIMQFANSLIGRQFKQVTQNCVFQMHDLTDGLQFVAWKAMGKLLPLLWYPEIDNMDEYLVNDSLASSTRLHSTANGIEQVDVETAISNVLDIFAMLDPTKILAKNKLHILTHTKADIRRHGPLLAPSRDIAHQLAHQEGLKHRLTGSWWFSSCTGSWECSGWAVRDFLSKHPILQALLGWTSPKQLEQALTPPLGSVELIPLKRIKGQPTLPRPDFTLEQTDAKVAMNIGSYTMDTIWQHCKTVVSKSHDECPLLSWVYVICPVTNTPTLGRIHDIFTSTTGSVVILDVFRILSEHHSIWNLPKLARRQGEQTLLIVPSTNDQNVQFIFNVQHDCYSAKCVASGSRAKKQERVDSNVNEAFIEHQPLEEHVINTTAFHNTHLLRRCLPRSTWAPVPMFTPENRLAKHNELAEQLRGKHSSQKAAKAAAAAAAAQAAVSNEGEPATSDGSQADTTAAAVGSSEAPGAMVATAAASSESSIARGSVAAEAAAFSSVVPTKQKCGQPIKNQRHLGRKNRLGLREGDRENTPRMTRIFRNLQAWQWIRSLRMREVVRRLRSMWIQVTRQEHRRRSRILQGQRGGPEDRQL